MNPENPPGADPSNDPSQSQGQDSQFQGNLSGDTVTITIPREYLDAATQVFGMLSQALAHAQSVASQQIQNQRQDGQSPSSGPGPYNPNKISPEDQAALVSEMSNGQD